jgi:hypothetical protein
VLHALHISSSLTYGIRLLTIIIMYILSPRFLSFL